MKTKSKIFLFLSLLCSIFFVGSAFSKFYFIDGSKFGEHEDKVHGYMDDIQVNYQLDDNAYTVYFFSSPYWANYIKNNARGTQTLDEWLSVDNYKTWMKNNQSATTDTLLKKYGYYEDGGEDSGEFGYKVRYADTCISTDTFSRLSNPTSTGRDNYQYKCLFNGWTYSITSAINCGYNSQGNYNYVSAFDELSLIDNADNDGDSTSNKVIFLYPVYSAGKRYSTIRQSVVRLHGRDVNLLKDDNGNLLDWNGKTNGKTSEQGIYWDTEYYFSQSDYSTSSSNINRGFYYYKNLQINSGEQLYLDVDTSMDGTWKNFWDGKGSRAEGLWTGEYSEWSGYSTSGRSELKPLFDTTGTDTNKKENDRCAVNDTGIYNIYVYLNTTRNTYDSVYTKYFKDITPSNTALVWYEDPSVGDSVTHSTTNNYTYVYIYVKIERVAQVGLGGGTTKSLEYSSSVQLNKSNIIPSTTSSARYYIANNVFLEGKDISDTITSYKKSDSTEYKYPSDSSAVLSNNSEPAICQKMADSELKTLTTKYQSVYGTNTPYRFWDTDNDAAYAKNAFDIVSINTIKSDGKTIENIPFPSTSYTDTDTYFIRPEKSGFFSIVVKFNMTSNAVSNKHYRTISYSACEVAVALAQAASNYVFLYEEGTTITMNGHFIETNTTKGSWFAYAKIDYGKPLTYDTKFTSRTSTNTWKLSELLGDTTISKHLTNHLTGREFRFDTSGESIKVKRNYAFYVMDGEWKEGEVVDKNQSQG